MNRSVYATLILSAALVVLSGCDPDVRREVILIKSLPSQTDKAEVINIVRPRTRIIWNSTFAFSIRFVDDYKACNEPQDTKYPEYYTAGTPSKGHYPYSVTCTLKDDIPPNQNLGYSIASYPPSKDIEKLPVTPCGGCAQQTEPNAGN